MKKMKGPKREDRIGNSITYGRGTSKAKRKTKATREK